MCLVIPITQKIAWFCSFTFLKKYPVDDWVWHWKLSLLLKNGPPSIQSYPFLLLNSFYWNLFNIIYTFIHYLFILLLKDPLKLGYLGTQDPAFCIFLIPPERLSLNKMCTVHWNIVCWKWMNKMLLKKKKNWLVECW